MLIDHAPPYLARGNHYCLLLQGKSYILRDITLIHGEIMVEQRMVYMILEWDVIHLLIFITLVCSDTSGISLTCFVICCFYVQFLIVFTCVV